MASRPLHVSGNRILNDLGQVVQLRGVNWGGPIYSCKAGGPVFAGPTPDQVWVDALKSWGINAVRVCMNEHCWLGIASGTHGATGAQYRTAINSVVTLLLNNDIWPILDMHFNAPGLNITDFQCYPDLDHAADFWGNDANSIANTWKSNNAVLFDLFNEPGFDVAPKSGNVDTVGAWTCWRDGSTAGNHAASSCNPFTTFPVAGMQTLVDAIRAAGSHNVCLLGGVRYANTLKQGANPGWTAYKPTDPDNNLVASWHVYNFNWHTNRTEWAAQAGQVLGAGYPVVALECGSNLTVAVPAGYGTAAPDTTDNALWLEDFLDWCDENGMGYMAWQWFTFNEAQVQWESLITSYTTGAPNGLPNGYGQTYKDHISVLGPPSGGGSPFNFRRFGGVKGAGQMQNGPGITVW